MSIYKNWQDFDSMRSRNKVLVIYGAGHNGHHFLNFCKIIPDYFCDKNASRKVIEGGGEIIPVLTLQELIVKLNGRAADILVSNLNEEIVKDLHKIFDKIKFTEDTVIYFHYLYNITDRKFTKSSFFYSYKMNNKRVREKIINLTFNADILKLFNNTDFLLKTACFDNTFLSTDEFEKFVKNIEFKVIFKKRRMVMTTIVGNNILPEEFKMPNKHIIYLFCDSRFVSFFSKKEYTLESMLSSMLNRGKNMNYRIENYSIGGFVDEKVIFQLTSLPLIKNSIVVISSILNPYLLAIAKQYCSKYECRLIYYFIPNIFFRNIFTDYEKWYLKEDKEIKKELKKLEKLGESVSGYKNPKLKLLAQTMDIEFYEPPNEFFNSDKTIYLDAWHIGDYGNKIIAEHLCGIIKSIKKRNFYDAFQLEPKEKIKYGLDVVPRIFPDIQSYLIKLKKFRQKSKNGAIVMNCNPFTLGHRYLIEYAKSKSEHLYIFVVEEDKSDFSFADRHELVRKNTADLKNITILPSGKFLASSVTFGEYFYKSAIPVERVSEIDVSLDLFTFAAIIAPELNIKTRFVGQEPIDPVTRHYNEDMKKILPEYGCEVVEIPRLEKDDYVVSAGNVRKLLKEGNFEEIKKIVPKATYMFLRQKYYCFGKARR